MRQNLFSNGFPLVAGGWNTSVEFLDLSTGQWIVTGSLTDARQEHTATILNDGTIIFVGGRARNSELLSSVERFTFN